MSAASNGGSIPPKPDPCLVDLFFMGIEWPWGVKKRREKAWIEARKCPRGCGSECQRFKHG